MYILLEGANAVGKTTLAKAFCKKHPHFTMVHIPKETPSPNASPAWFINDMADAIKELAPRRNYVFTRMWPSAMVYSKWPTEHLAEIAPVVSLSFIDFTKIYLWVANDVLVRRLNLNQDNMDRLLKTADWITDTHSLVSITATLVDRYKEVINAEGEDWVRLCSEYPVDVLVPRLEKILGMNGGENA